jgi:hypothetical protein
LDLINSAYRENPKKNTFDQVKKGSFKWNRKRGFFHHTRGGIMLKQGELNGIVAPENRFEQELAWLQRGRANWLRHGD